MFVDILLHEIHTEKKQKFMKLSFLKHLKINFQIDYLMEHFKLLEYKLLWSFQAP